VTVLTGMLPESHALLASLVAWENTFQRSSGHYDCWSHGRVALLGYRLVVRRRLPVTVSLSAGQSPVLLTQSL
jgi:hypothetical protein